MIAFQIKEGELCKKSHCRTNLILWNVMRSKRVLPFILSKNILDKRDAYLAVCQTTAMHLLQSGVDITVLALWLGHKQTNTTHRYLNSDMAMKERMPQKLPHPHTNAVSFKTADPLLKFLESL